MPDNDDKQEIPPSALPVREGIESENDQAASSSTETVSIADPPSPQASNDTTAELDATQDFDPDATADFQWSTDTVTAQKKTLPGRIGNHRILGVLGRGGMGVVYLAYHEVLKRNVALKMMLAGEHASPEQIQRFVAEARAVAKLQHSQIVQIFDIGYYDQMPYFSLEFVDGKPLDKMLRRQTLSEQDAARLMEKICVTLQYAHEQGIFHRDLKPGNVLITKDGQPKVTDFGLARMVEDNQEESSKTKTGTIMGTPSYMSPEQALGNVHAMNATSDQYSLGAMLFEMLTGRPPFTGAHPMETILQVIHQEPVAPRQLRPNLSADIEVICLKALQKDANKRYPSCLAMAEDLGRFLRNEPIHARPVSVRERFWRWCRRNPVIASLTILAATALTAVAVISTWSAVRINAASVELNEKNVSLKKSAIQLAESAEDLREKNETLEQRTQRLQQFVQTMFDELRNFNVDESPRSKPARDRLLSTFNDIMIEVVKELPKEGNTEPVYLAVKMGLFDSLIDQQRTDDAEAILEEVGPIFKRRIELKGGSDSSRNNLTLWASKYGSLKRDLRRDRRASLEAYQQALALAESIVQEPKASPDGKGRLPRYMAKSLLADVHNDLGVTYYRFGDPQQALMHMQSSQKLREQALREFDTDETLAAMPAEKRMSSHNLLAESLEYHKLSMGATLFRVGKFSEAEPLLKNMFTASREALSRDPSNPRLRNDYVGQAGLWAEFLGFSGRDQEALSVLEASAKELSQLIADDPNGVAFSRTVTVALYRLSQWRQLMKQGDSQTPLKKCLEFRRALMEKEPNNDRRQLDLLVVLGRSGDFNQGESSHALAIVKQFQSRTNLDPEMLVDVARALSQASAMATDESAKSKFASQAYETLERAHIEGFNDVVYLKGEPDLRNLAKLDEAIAGWR